MDNVNLIMLSDSWEREVQSLPFYIFQNPTPGSGKHLWKGINIEYQIIKKDGDSNI